MLNAKIACSVHAYTYVDKYGSDYAGQTDAYVQVKHDGCNCKMKIENFGNIHVEHRRGRN